MKTLLTRSPPPSAAWANSTGAGGHDEAIGTAVDETYRRDWPGHAETGPRRLDDLWVEHHDKEGLMEDEDDVLVGDLIDVSALDVERILTTEGTPLDGCLRRLIQLNSRPGSAIAGFESFIGGDEPTDVG